MGEQNRRVLRLLRVSAVANGLTNTKAAMLLFFVYHTKQKFINIFIKLEYNEIITVWHQRTIVENSSSLSNLAHMNEI